MRNWAFPAMAALALAGCERAPDPEPAPTPTPTPAASDREPVSIIREDIEVEREEAPLAQFDLRIGFPDGGAELSDKALNDLAAMLETPQFAAGGGIVLRGHSDSAGSDDANLRAAKSRAEAVRDWLIERDVPERRILVLSFGEQNPVEPNALPDGEPNEKGRAANRRVDVTIEVPEGTPEAAPNGPPETLVDGLTRPREE